MVKRKEKKTRKRGLSQIVTTVLIILIILVFIGILYAFIFGYTDNRMSKTKTNLKCSDVLVKAVDFSRVSPDGSSYAVSLKRDVRGVSEPVGVKLVFLGDGAYSNVVDFGEELSPLEFSRRTVSLDSPVLSAEDVEVVPYLINSETGEEEYCVYSKVISKASEQLGELSKDKCRNINECPGGNACQFAICDGDPKECSLGEITMCIDSDGCCAPGCDLSTDSDCVPPEPPKDERELDVYLPFEESPLKPYTSFLSPNDNGCFTIDWTDDYERAMCVSYTRTYEDGDVLSEQSSLHSRVGSYSGRFFLRATPLSDWPTNELITHRNEMHPQGDYSFPSLGAERWYGFSVLFGEGSNFPPAGLESDLRFMMAHWQNSGAASVAFMVWGDEIVLVRNEGTSTSWSAFDSESLRTIVPGQWMDFVVRIKFDHTDGIVEIWEGGELIYSDYGRSTVYSDLGIGGAFRFGIDHWKWKNYEDVQTAYSSGVYERELFFDEIKIFEGTDAFSLVSP